MWEDERSSAFLAELSRVRIPLVFCLSLRRLFGGRHNSSSSTKVYGEFRFGEVLLAVVSCTVWVGVSILNSSSRIEGIKQKVPSPRL